MEDNLEIIEYYEYLNKLELDKKRKRPLIFAIIGLLLGPFMGIGFIFSGLSLITWFRLKKLGGTSLKWAIVLAIIGLILNLSFYIILNIFALNIPSVI